MTPREALLRDMARNHADFTASSRKEMLAEADRLQAERLAAL